MSLQNWEKQRLKAYNECLKQQMQKQIKVKKEMDSYQHKKQQIHMNEIVGRLDRDDVRRLNMRKNNALLLQQHNNQMDQLKKSGSRIQENYSLPKSPSFQQQISSQDKIRLSKLKQGLKDQHHLNQMQQNEKKNMTNQYKLNQQDQEFKHMDRVSEIDNQRQRQYHNTIKKHQQNMKLYEMHNQLSHQNDQYRKNIEKFTDTEQDILHNVWRNQEQQRKRIYLQNQELLKKQMDEFNQKKSIEKIHIQKGDDIDKGIFRSVMRNDQRNRKLYGEDLKAQMYEMEKRKSQQKQEYKEKLQISGIYGGEHGRDRVHQIQYIDKKMGLKPKLDMSFELQKSLYGSEHTSPRKATPKINNVEEAKSNGNQHEQKRNEIRYNNSQVKNQNSSNLNEFPDSSQIKQVQINYNNYKQTPKNEGMKYYRSFDVVSNRSRYYN